MGPSGAGKSTLLNIISGFQKKGLKGTIRTSNEQESDNKVKYKKDSCYILQDDRLCPLFTVQEIMVTATKLKLGNSISEKAKEILIFDILDTLGLTNCMETICGKLSGGQRKRLSVALELVDNPPIMFLDEPTTGLDSSASLQCITTLKGLSQGGRTIVCTIHQPSATIFEMFDHIYILAEGHCIYQGAPQLTVNYLSSVGLNCPQYHNPADYILEVANEEYGKFNEILSKISSNKSWRIEEKPPLKISDEREIINKTMVLVNSPSEMYKFWVLLHRCFIQLYRDWTATQLKLLLHIFVGIIMGLNFYGHGKTASTSISNTGFLIITIIYLSYTALIPAVVGFPNELPIIKKESFNNWYKLRTYYLATIVAGIPAQVLYAFAYTTITYMLTGQPMEFNRYLRFLLITILVNIIADSLGLLIGTLLNPVNGTFVGAVMTAYWLLLGGFLILFKHMSLPFYLLTYTSFMSYGWEGLMAAIYGFNREKIECPIGTTYCPYVYPKALLTDMGIEKHVYGNDVITLVGQILVIKLVAFFSLKRMVKKN